MKPSNDRDKHLDGKRNVLSITTRTMIGEKLVSLFGVTKTEANTFPIFSRAPCLVVSVAPFVNVLSW
jgi:hypothetical protein